MSNTRRRKKMTLRDALAAKQVRTAHYDIPVVDSATALAAGKALQDAKKTFLVADMGTDDALRKAAQAALDLAQAEVDACSYRLELRAIPDADLDAVRNEHTVDDKVKTSEDPFAYALLAATVVDGDMTGEEWLEEMHSERWREADRNELLGLVLDVNLRPFSAGIPKG